MKTFVIKETITIPEKKVYFAVATEYKGMQQFIKPTTT